MSSGQLAQAQTSGAATLDVGSFSLVVNGERTGREQFSIRQSPSPDGVTLEFRAESSSGDKRAAYRLETDSLGSPLRYAAELRGANEVTLRLGGQRVRGRFSTLARGVRGEAAREYLLADGALVLDDEVVHQHAALVRRRGGLKAGDSVSVTVLSPLANRQYNVWLVCEARDDAVIIGGVPRPAIRWAVNPAGGDRRTFWADNEGRLLRLVIPARHFEALRDDVPR